MVNEKMEVIEEVGEIEYWRETMTQTNSLRYLVEQDADGVQTTDGKDVKTGSQLSSRAGILACSKLQMAPDCRLVRG